MKLYLIILLLCIQCVPDRKPNSCDIFLNKQNHKFQELFTIQLKELTFMSCEKTFDHQLQVLETWYQVNGENARFVENYLEKKYNMGKLKFICCGWEIGLVDGVKGYGDYKDKANYNHSVRMYSEETLKENWEKIIFYVQDILYLEGP